MSDSDLDIDYNLLKMDIINARKSSHISQKQAAESANISIGTVSMIESIDRDGSGPGLKTLMKYLSSMGYRIRIEKIIKDEELQVK